MYTKPMYLDRKLCQDVIVHPLAHEKPDLYGLEIELEGKNVVTLDPWVCAYWATHKDNSLRVIQLGGECTEYVFKQPYDREETGIALDKLYAHLHSPGVEVFPSYRTSIHVHLSMALETHRHIYNFMTLSTIFDELFVSQNGQHRVGNNFCLRARDAQGQLNEIIKSIEQNGNFFDLHPDHRYSSVNYASLMKFGTVEFRSLECTTDKARVEHWVDTLSRLRVVARSFDNPQKIISYYSKMSAKEFLYFVLGPQAAKYHEVEGWDIMLHRGMRLAQDLAYCSKWVNKKAKDEEPKKAAPKKKKLVEHVAFDPFAGPDWAIPMPPPQPAPLPEINWAQIHANVQAQLHAQGAGHWANPAVLHDEIELP